MTEAISTEIQSDNNKASKKFSTQKTIFFSCLVLGLIFLLGLTFIVAKAGTISKSKYNKVVEENERLSSESQDIQNRLDLCIDIMDNAIAANLFAALGDADNFTEYTDKFDSDDTNECRGEEE